MPNTIPDMYGLGNMPAAVAPNAPSINPFSGMAMQALQNTGAGRQTAAGRFDNPTAEIRRLLDELERNRQQVGGISLSPTADDISLQQQIQAATLGPALARVSGQFGARGLSGSSMEAMQRSLMANQIALQSQQQLRDIGMQRGEFELSRNQQLFNALTGALQYTTMPGAPGTQQKKKGGGVLGAIGGVLGGIAGSALGPIGTALGSRVGGYIGGAAGGK